MYMGILRSLPWSFLMHLEIRRKPSKKYPCGHVPLVAPNCGILRVKVPKEA